MEKQIIISKEPISITKRQGNILAYLAVVPTHASQSQTHEPDEKGNMVLKDITSINFSVRLIEGEKLEQTSIEDVLNLTNGVTRFEDGENYQIDLTKMPLPKLVLKDFENSFQMQDFINAYYLQMVLNEGKDYNVNEWVLWKK